MVNLKDNFFTIKLYFDLLEIEKIENDIYVFFCISYWPLELHNKLAKKIVYPCSPPPALPPIFPFPSGGKLFKIINNTCVYISKDKNPLICREKIVGYRLLLELQGELENSWV